MDDYSAQWRHYRRLNRLGFVAFAVAAAALPLSIVLDRLGYPRAVSDAAFPWLGVIGSLSLWVVFLLIGSWRCPRCYSRYSSVIGWQMLKRRCMHCGLGLYEGDRKPIVLGQQMADARSAERARLDAGEVTPSPLAGKAYDAERGEFNLTSLVESALDSEVSRVVEAWVVSAARQWEDVRRSLSLGDNYTLIQFARRMAVRALNAPASDAFARGLSALAMIDETRIDSRDASSAAGLLNHAAPKLIGRSTTELDRAMNLATPRMAELMRQSKTSTLREWGYREWPTTTGVGLIRSGLAEYEPTVDLVAVADRVAAEILSHRYVVEIEVATAVPDVWFAQGSRAHATKLLERSPGVVSIRGTLRRSTGRTTGQMFILWIAEVASPADGLQLVADVGEDAGGRFVVGESVRCLFALLVAGSYQIGVEPVETLASLKEYGRRVRALLEGSAN
jgi:hypothetical protein